MPRRSRRNHSPAFKAKVALAAVKRERTFAELVDQFDAYIESDPRLEKAVNHQGGKCLWRERRRRCRPGTDPVDITCQDWAINDGEGFSSHRARIRPMTERKAMIKAKQPLSLTRQCQLLAVHRSSAYVRSQLVSVEDLTLMRFLDELYLQWPFYGSRRLCIELLQQRGHRVNRKRVQRLMRKMRLRAIYPKPRT